MRPSVFSCHDSVHNLNSSCKSAIEIVFKCNVLLSAILHNFKRIRVYAWIFLFKEIKLCKRHREREKPFEGSSEGKTNRPEIQLQATKMSGRTNLLLFMNGKRERERVKKAQENENKPITNLLNSKASNQPLRRLLRFGPMDFQCEGAARTPPTQIC